MPHDQELDEYDRAAAKYPAAYMSNAKWRKLFLSLDHAGVRIDRAEWRFIDSEHVLMIGLPREHELDTIRLRDGRFQPTEYKWIESILVPFEYRPYPDVGYTVKQDVQRMVEVLRGVAAFMLVDRTHGVAILGYGGNVRVAG